MAKRKTSYKPRKQKQIQHFSRAINKIDDSLYRSPIGQNRIIKEAKAGINTITYNIDGIDKEVRYDQIEFLPRSEQGALIKRLSIERARLREERAFEQLQEKGKISWQFKRALAEDSKLLESIQDLETMIGESGAGAIKSEFEKISLDTGDAWMDEADSYFQGKDGTPQLNDFYQGTGFSYLNSFTWNAYKVLKGL